MLQSTLSVKHYTYLQIRPRIPSPLCDKLRNLPSNPVSMGPAQKVYPTLTGHQPCLNRVLEQGDISLGLLEAEDNIIRALESS